MSFSTKRFDVNDLDRIQNEKFFMKNNEKYTYFSIKLMK